MTCSIYLIYSVLICPWFTMFHCNLVIIDFTHIFQDHLTGTGCHHLTAHMPVKQLGKILVNINLPGTYYINGLVQDLSQITIKIDTFWFKKIHFIFFCKVTTILSFVLASIYLDKYEYSCKAVKAAFSHSQPSLDSLGFITQRKWCYWIFNKQRKYLT